MPSQESAPDLTDLFNLASRSVRSKWRTALLPLAVTPHQARTLVLLGRANGQGMRNSQVAEKLHIAARSTTEVIDQLVAKNLAERTPDPADRRATLILLTSLGQELLIRLRTERRHTYDDYFSVLQPKDRAELTRLLGLLVTDRPEGSTLPGEH